MSATSPLVSGSDQPLVVYCAGNAFSDSIGTDQQIAERLSGRSRVLYVDPAISARPRNLQRLRETPLKQIGDRLWRLTPMAPPGVTRPISRNVAHSLTRGATKRAIDRLGGPVQAIVVSSLAPLLRMSDARHRVFFGTDDFRAGAALMGLSPSWVAKHERVQLTEATAVVAVSEPLAESWRPFNSNVVVIPNGCDVARFADVDAVEAAPDIALEPPIAGLIGQINERIDLSMLEAVADLGLSLLLVGPTAGPLDHRRFDALVGRSNVQWIGGRPFEEIPKYMRAVKVGLTPYTDTEFNRASFPLKTLEYLAAGRAAVVSDLPASHALQTELISIASGPSEFARRTREALQSAEPDGIRSRRQELASTHSWDRRAGEFAQLIGLLDDDSKPSTQSSA